MEKKKTRKPFPQTTWRSTHKLQLMHKDVNIRGPQITTSLNCSLYYIIFIDDYSRFCWLYFLKFKFKVTNVFWKYKTWVKNQSDWRIQTIRSDNDNGKEYTSGSFQ
jgi:hypothetical protein